MRRSSGGPPRPHGDLGEAEIGQQLRERSPRVQVQVIAERLRESLDAAERDRDAAVGRRRQQQSAARCEHAPDLRQPRSGVRDVLDHLARPHELERCHRAGAARRAARGELEGRVASARAPSAASATSTPTASAPAPRSRREVAGAAAEIQHALAWPDQPSRNARRSSQSGGTRPAGSRSTDLRSSPSSRGRVRGIAASVTRHLEWATGNDSRAARDHASRPSRRGRDALLRLLAGLSARGW